jgi:maleylacetoacetate isomerase
MSAATPLLYSYFRSSCSYRVRIALNLKHVDFAQRAIHLVKGEQLSDTYRTINPMQVLPALEIDGNVLTQSLAIIEYLEETVPEPALLPKSPVHRAQVRAIAMAIACDIQPVQNLRVLKKMGDADAKNAWGKDVIQRGFVAVEAMFEKCAGKYCFGDNVTLADVCLVPQVYNAKRFEVDMSQFPIISRIDAALSDLPEFKKAHPSRQPDTPDDLRATD